MLPERGFELREMLLHHVADNLAIHPEVLVNQNVAESPDLRPWDVWVRSNNVSRQMSDGLTDHLEVALDGSHNVTDPLST